MTEQMQRGEGPAQRGSHALSEALRLQVTAQERAAAPARKHGKRRKGDVVDLDRRTFTRSRGHRWLMAMLILEAVVAVIAVGVLVAYLVLEGDTLQ